MPKLTVKQNRLDYRGAFERPLLSLWGDGKTIYQGLYNTFSPYGVALADIRNETEGNSPSDQIVGVNFGRNASYKLKMDAIEMSVTNFTQDDIGATAQLLESGDNWLRSFVPEVAFQSHLMSALSHSQLSEGDLHGFLSGIAGVKPVSLGVERGNGIIYHWEFPDRDWNLHLTLDHSLVVGGGLYINFIIIMLGDRVDYKASFEAGYALYKEVLNAHGLELVE